MSKTLKTLNYSVLHNWVRVIVFNATFNNILVILWRSVLLVEETGVSGENHWPVASHWKTLSHNVVSSTPHLSGELLMFFPNTYMSKVMWSNTNHLYTVRYDIIYNYCFHMRWTSKVDNLSRVDNLMFTSSEENNCFIIPKLL
jgi:hypothetical protein